MNKIYNKLSLVFVLLFLNCKSVNNKILVTQKKVNHEIMIRLAKDNKNRVLRIQFPNKIVLTNKSSKDRDFLTIDYKYNNIPSNRNLNLGIYVNENEKLKRVRNNKKKTILSNSSLSFILYSRHFVDSSKQTQQQFKPYVKKMLAANKDTLHIGTVDEFKLKHKKLFEKLTNNDSILIRFLEGKKLGERITVPVEW